MKLKYILTALLASFILFGCEDQFKLYLDEVQVSSSYIGIPKSGGQTTITITATESWSINGIPSWLTVTPANGSAGETSVTFKANYTDNNNKVTLSLICGEGEQYINVVQGVEPPPVSPIKDILKDGKPGTIYRAEGKVSGIYNTQYGNWYLVDNEGNELLIYGTLDKNGTTKNFSSLGINNDDIVVVEGPLTIYNGTYELVDVTVLSHIKTLVKLFSEPESITRDGGDFIVELDLKGSGLIVNIPSAAQSWLHYSGNQTIYDEKRDKDVTVAYFSADANNGGVRSANITFSTKNTDPKDNMVYSATTNIIQEGSIIQTTIDKLLAVEDGDTQYRTTGYITRLYQNKDNDKIYGNYYIADATGEICVYGTLDKDGNTKNFGSLGIKVGDIVTIVGPKTSYNNSPQLKNVSVESHISVAPISVADFLDKPTGSDYFQLTGVVGPLNDGDVYGNFDLTDSTGTIYVYGLLSGWGGEKKLFQTLIAEKGIKEGDTITIVGQRSVYKDKPQVNAAFYVSKAE